MRVSRIQAAENRETVINVASRLFREHGFDGIGLKDLMKGAGLTQGAFYKQFASKDDLAAQASRRALESAFSRWSAAAAANPKDPLGAVIAFYLSMGASRRKDGRLPDRGARLRCRQTGRRREGVIRSRDQGAPRSPRPLGCRDRWRGAQGKAMAILSTMVGAVPLSRAVNDERLSKRFLQAAAESVLMASSAGDAQRGPRR